MTRKRSADHGLNQIILDELSDRIPFASVEKLRSLTGFCGNPRNPRKNGVLAGPRAEKLRAGNEPWSTELRQNSFGVTFLSFRDQRGFHFKTQSREKFLIIPWRSASFGTQKAFLCRLRRTSNLIVLGFLMIFALLINLTFFYKRRL
jgi:hypothetical protein